MAKQTKDETLNLFYMKTEPNKKKSKKQTMQKAKVAKKSSNAIGKKNSTNKKNKANKIKEENTKDERFNFDEEIIIGLKRIEPEEDKPRKDKGLKKDKVSNNKKGTKQKVKRSQVKEKDNINMGEIYKKQKKQMAQKKLSPKQELARKKRKAIFRIMKWLTLLLIVIGGGIYALLSPLFNIKNIQVIGNSKISETEIISLSRVELDQNMFQYRSKDIIGAIKQNAYIDTVKVKRRLPDTIELVISERKASFMIKIANAYAYISNQGYIVEISDKKEDLPILVGGQTLQENMQEGYRLCKEDLERLSDVLKIMESATSNGLEKLITQIDMKDKTNYVLTLQSKKKTVYLGDTSNLSTKMLYIIQFNATEGNTPGEIILNMNLNNEKNKPYFREKV